MAGNCGVCNEPVRGPDSVKCSGTCNRCFHKDCLPIEQVKKLNTKQDWCCDQCKKYKGKPTSSQHNISSAATGNTEEFLIKTLEAFKAEMIAELKANSNEFVQFRESMNMFSCKIDEATKLMEETNKRLSKIEKENKELREKNVELQGTVKDLQVRMRNMEQYSRKNNIEVSGIPSTRGEDVISILKDVGTAIGVELKTEDVQAAHRVPTFKAGRTPPLVVQFVSRKTRDTWLAAYRERRDMVASDINKAFPTRKVFLNEHLTPETKVLLARTKDSCKNLGYKYIWCREGKVFVRKDEGQKSVRVDSLDDLAKIQ